MARLAAAAVGVVFGFTLAWSAMAEPDVIRRGLLFEEAYLFVLFATALGTATAGLWLLRRARVRALATGEPVGWEPSSPERRHVFGSALFGTGWAVSAACPGPIVVQAGAGVIWGFATLAGVALGVAVYLERERRAPPQISPSQ